MTTKELEALKLANNEEWFITPDEIDDEIAKSLEDKGFVGCYDGGWWITYDGIDALREAGVEIYDEGDNKDNKNIVDTITAIAEAVKSANIAHEFHVFLVHEELFLAQIMTDAEEKATPE